RAYAGPASDKENVHRAGRVSGGLLNPSVGRVTDPGTNPFSHNQKTNSITISRVAMNFALPIFKKVSPRDADPITRLDSRGHAVALGKGGSIPRQPITEARFDVRCSMFDVRRFPSSTHARAHTHARNRFCPG